MSTADPRSISFSQFANTYVPFGLLLTLALLLPEQTQNPDLYRTKLTIWATTLLLIPSLCLYLFWGVSSRVNQYWLLFWSFSYVTYLVHVYYGTFVQLDGIRDTFATQGLWIAGANFLVTIWWGVDVVLAWARRSPPNWMRMQRLALSLFVFVIFVVGNVFLRGGPIRGLGIFMAVVVGLCFLTRLYIVPKGADRARTT